jgi:hypothetical protein
VRLARIFDNRNAPRSRQLLDYIHIRDIAAQVHRKQAAGAFGHHGFQLVDIQLEGFQVGIHKHGQGILLDDGIDGCHESVGGDEDFIARSHFQGAKRRIDGVCAIHDAGGVFGPKKACSFLLKISGDFAVEPAPLFSFQGIEEELFIVFLDNRPAGPRPGTNGSTAEDRRLAGALGLNLGV